MVKVSRRTARFLNKQFALIIIAFFVLSLNVVSAPVSIDSNANVLLNYEPDAVVTATGAINKYVPIISQMDPREVADQVASAVIGPQTGYVPKPLIPETINHKTADLIRRGLRREIVTHTVEQGETISKIASDYGINTATILRDNHMTLADVDKIKPGSKLSIAPESSSDAVAWLDKLRQEDQKVRLKAEQAKLAKTRAGRLALLSKASAEGDPNNNDVGSVSGFSGRFSRPINGARTCYNGYHLWAIDCPAPIGSSVVAAASGTVVLADPSGYNGGYGITVVIDHGNGWKTRYAHMSRLEVNVGDRVGAGDLVGRSGNTGHTTGPHLHFETIFGGQRINPITVTSL